MGTYIAARLMQLVFVLFGVSVVVFLTMHLLPGDVAQLLLGDHATNEQLQRLRVTARPRPAGLGAVPAFHARRADRRSRDIDPEQPSRRSTMWLPLFR